VRSNGAAPVKSIEALTESSSVGSSSYTSKSFLMSVTAPATSQFKETCWTIVCNEAGARQQLQGIALRW
jgi:hypothetical protein